MIKMEQFVQIMKASKVLEMAEKEMLPIAILKISIEEFSRVQTYMILTEDKESAAYSEMKDRYFELKVILTSSGIILAVEKTDHQYNEMHTAA